MGMHKIHPGPTLHNRITSNHLIPPNDPILRHGRRGAFPNCLPYG
jgi:hypothetical protein